MKHFLHLILLLSIFKSNAQFNSVSSGTTTNLINVKFADDTTVYVTGMSGIILKSTDDGLTWTQLSSGVSEDLYACFFLSKDIGFVAGNGGVLIKTENGGASWQQSSLNNSDLVFRCLYFKNSLDGYALGTNMASGDGVLYSTNDGGNTWSGPSTHNQVQSMDFLGDMGFISGLNGMIKRTTDGGQTWSSVISNTAHAVGDIFIVNEKLIFASGGSPTGGSGCILRSTDGGQTFNPAISGLTDYITCVFFLDDFTGYAIGGQFPSNSSAKILRTTDGGNTWLTVPTTGRRLFRGTFEGSDRGIIVGLDGQVLRYNSNFNVIKGLIYDDENNNCLPNSSEEGLGGILVKTEPGPYYGVSDTTGNYEILVPEAGTFSVEQLLDNNKFISPLCPSGSHSVSFSGLNNRKENINFGNNVKECHLLTANITSTRRRRCFTSYTQISYCNEGNIAANNAKLEVVYPQYVIPLSSSVNWTSKVDSIITYNLPIIEAGQCGYIKIKDSVICGNESIRGLTACTKVNISPAESCTTPATDWDRSSIKVSGNCDNGVVKMEILNGGSGDMTSQHPYRVYIDDTLIYNGSFILGSGEMLVVEILAEGRTIRLEADQHPEHPGKSHPRETIEGCTGSGTTEISKGLVLTAPLDNLDEFIDIDCLPIIDSYDPNDKQVSPIGISDNRYIYNDNILEYIIRFQNTGTDTAYTVVIKDTLDSDLDPLSIEINGASHQFTWDLKGTDVPVLTFRFNNINLPDSTKDEAKSHGFVRFKVNQKENNSVGTEITNVANIYFDYNSPIVTNETYNEIWDTYPQGLSQQNKILSTTIIAGVKTNADIQFSMHPNPFKETLFVNLTESGNYSLCIYDAYGRVISEEIFTLKTGGIKEVNSSSLSEGIYFVRITSADGNTGQCKIIKK